MSSAGLVQVYIADPEGAATPVMADALDPPFTATPERVTLTVDCLQLIPNGWPSPPDETGTVGDTLWYPRTISAGTTITAFVCVANALIAAGAATLA